MPCLLFHTVSKSRLLTTMAYVVLTLLSWVGTGQAGGYFQIGDALGTADATTSIENAIVHTEIVLAAGDVPCVIDSIVAHLVNNVTSATDHKVAMAIYSVDGTTVLDSVAEFVLDAAEQTKEYRAHPTVEKYVFTVAGTYNLAVWSEAVSGSIEFDMESIGGHSTYIMVSQTYDGSWPSLSDDNEQASKWGLIYAVVRKGNTIISGTTDIEDATLNDGGLGGDNLNYGASTTSQIDTAAGANCDYLAIRVKNVATRVGVDKTVDACTAWVYVATAATGDSLLFFELLQDWEEGTQTGQACSGSGLTWLEYACVLNSAWGTEGAASFGTDITNPRESGVDVSSVGWYGFDVTTLAQEWYAGTTTENGGLLRHEADNPGLSITVNTSENAANQPYFSFYTNDAAAASGVNPRRLRANSGGQQ